MLLRARPMKVGRVLMLTIGGEQEVQPGMAVIAEAAAQKR